MDPFDYIASHLEAKKLSERQFSLDLGMSPGYLFSLRSGRHFAKVSVAKRIASVLVAEGSLAEEEKDSFVGAMVGLCAPVSSAA